MQEAAALKRTFEEQQRQQLLLAQEEDRRREEMRLEALQQEEKRRQKRAEEQAAFKRRLKEEEDKRRRDAAEAQRRLEAEQENARRLEREARLAEGKREQEERVEQWKRFKREYPVPEHLKNFVNEVTDATPTVSLRRFVNVAFVGSSGKGKSSLIRVVLKYFGITLPAEQMPRVSAQGDGTTEATRYPLTNLSDRASLWDHPGQGTEQVHSLTYLRDIGLKYFDLAVLVTDGRWSQGDIQLMNAIRAAEIPFLIARTKVDLAVEAGQHEWNWTQEKTLESVRNKVREETCIEDGRIHLVTARERHWNTFGSVEPLCLQLKQEILASIAKQF